MQYQPQLRTDQITALYHLKVELRRPMTTLAREAVDLFLERMKRKQEEAAHVGSTLAEWLANENARTEASVAAKQTADLNDTNALC